MAAYLRCSIALLLCLTLGVAGGCSTTTTDTTGNTSTDGANSNDNSSAPDDGASGDTSPGFAAFTAAGCASCHPSQATDFSNSTTDAIVDSLLGDVEHPGGAFGDLTDLEIDNITDFIISVMLGDESLDGSSEPDDIDTNGEDTNTNGTGGDGGDATPTPDWFVQVWSEFDYNYSHFETKGVDWNAVRLAYEPEFLRDMNEAEFLDLIAQMLAELQDLHVWLFDSAGEVVEVYSRPASPNYPNFYPDGVVQMGSYPLWHGMLDGNIAFISIETFDSSQWEGLRTGEVDDLFATYAGADAMIIDVRFNNGGDETIARVFAGHLAESSYVYGYHRTKNPGADHSDFAEFTEHRLEPAENARFLNPAACLIGERNMSSAEWFVLMMTENPRTVTLVGDTTRGSSGSPQEYSLAGGIKYYIPSWEAYRADQTTRIEDVGIAPDPGYDLSPEASFTADRDYVLERAIEALAQ